MGNPDEIKAGTEVTVTVEKRGSDLRVAKDGVDCKVLTDYEGDLSQGQRMTVTGKVSKAIYDTDNSVEMFIVEAESTEVTEQSKRKEKPASLKTDNSSSPSDSGPVSGPQSGTESRQNSPGLSHSHSESLPRRSGKESVQSDALDEIAEDLIGDQELEIEGDEESVVGAAKQRAKNQQRDPAIDPKLPDE